MVSAGRDAPVLSVVVPVYNEEENIPVFAGRVVPLLSGLRIPFEVIFVDDGSHDGTARAVTAAATANPAIRLLRLSRNFGHQAALFAGLEAARGQAVVTMDGDLQHPPELIPQLVARWQAGVDVVQTIRRETAGLGVLRKASSDGFYRLLSAVSRIQVTPGAADFRLLSRVALDAFLACKERRRFNRGLVQWIGFSYEEIPYDAAPRHAGQTKYTLRKMLRLAGDAIFSFSTLPLRIAGLAGGLVSLLAAGYLLYVLYAKLFTTMPIELGWTSLQASVLIIGGVQLMVMWILGEYVGRLYEEVKQRPIYIIRPNATGPRVEPVTREVEGVAADSAGGQAQRRATTPAREEC